MQDGGSKNNGPSALDRVIRLSLENRLVMPIIMLAVILWGFRAWRTDDTLGTLNAVLIDEFLMTAIVALVILMNRRAALLISGMFPITVLAVFITIRSFRPDADIIALSGLALAVGMIVDRGLVVTENIVRHLAAAGPQEPHLEVIYRAVSEVGGAVLAATVATGISFLPLFALAGHEGKLLMPLAWTETFALVFAALVSLVIIPPLAVMILRSENKRKKRRSYWLGLILIGASIIIVSMGLKFVASAHLFVGLWLLAGRYLPEKFRGWVSGHWTHIAIGAVVVLLTMHWRPLGYENSLLINILFVAGLIGVVLHLFKFFLRSCEPVLRWCLAHRKIFLSLAMLFVFLGAVALKRIMPSPGEGSFLHIPASMQFAAGSKFAVILPISLLAIFLVIYLQFRKVLPTLMVFSGIFVVWAGGFIMLWLYGRGWFLDFSLFGVDIRELFNIRPYNLSASVWVGFLVLSGISSNVVILMSTCLEQTFAKKKPGNPGEIRDTVVLAAMRRVRPALMTSATTILALIPVLTSTGKGVDIMVQMAIPSFGGMTVVMISVFLVPVLYSIMAERRLGRASS